MTAASETEEGQYGLIGKQGVRLEVTSARVRVLAGKPNAPMTLSVHRPTGYAGQIEVNRNGDMIVVRETQDPASKHKPRLSLRVPMVMRLQIRLSGCSSFVTEADLTHCE